MVELTTEPDVVFAGENPALMLYAPGTDEVVAVASWWHGVHSAAGGGDALVIWTDPIATGLGDDAPTGIYTDNADMAALVWDHFNRHWSMLQNRGIEDRPVVPTRFVRQADGMRLHRVACMVGASTIELEWRDGRELFHATARTEVGGSRWEVANVVIPCADGGIRVDGRDATGEVHFPEGDYHSSAFLAMCESWVRLG